MLNWYSVFFHYFFLHAILVFYQKNSSISDICGFGVHGKIVFFHCRSTCAKYGLGLKLSFHLVHSTKCINLMILASGEYLMVSKDYEKSYLLLLVFFFHVSYIPSFQLYKIAFTLRSSLHVKPSRKINHSIRVWCRKKREQIFYFMIIFHYIRFTTQLIHW